MVDESTMISGGAYAVIKVGGHEIVGAVDHDPDPVAAPSAKNTGIRA